MEQRRGKQTRRDGTGFGVYIPVTPARTRPEEGENRPARVATGLLQSLDRKSGDSPSPFIGAFIRYTV